MRLTRLWALAIVACAICPLTAPAAWQTLGKVERVQRSDEALELATTSGAALRISFVSADVVRVRMSPTGAFADDFSYAVENKPRTPVKLHIDNENGALVLRGPAHSASVRVAQQPQVLIEILDGEGRLVLADDPNRPMAFDAATGAIEASKRRSPFELYYGFGEKALPMSRHQQYMTMWNSDTPGYGSGLDPIYETIPFFIALSQGKSYGVFLDNTYRSHFDMGKTEISRYVFGAAGGELDYYVFTGGHARSPANVLRDYTALTGRGDLPPLWALGYQQSRYSYTPDAKVREIAQTFRSKRIPADVIYLDIGYMDGYRIFTWSPQDFPDPQALLHDLHRQDFHAVTIVDPGVKVDAHFPIYGAGRDEHVFTRTGAGEELHATVWPGLCAFPDFTNANARAWFGSLYAGFLDQGVDGFWNDMNEPGVFVPADSEEPALVHDPRKTFPLDAKHDGDGHPGTHARYHNVYGMQMARATFEGLRRLRAQQRPFVLTRAGYAGVQRYSAVWTGDNASTWEHLALSIPMLTNLSISGVPFVGADIGGFTGSPSGELYARWLQAAALTPFMRTHSAIDTEPREPWSYGADFEAINRKTIELRYRLLPYLYTLLAQSEAAGLPPMRPLWFAYPTDAAALLNDDEFLVGRDLLVAPVVREGETKRRVYFPKGDTWFDWQDGTRHGGGTFADVAAPIERLPLFMRAGASIPTVPVIQSTAELPRTPLTIIAALGADGESSVYQDKGEGYAYREGDSRTIRATLRGMTLHLDIPKSERYQRVGAVEFIGAGAKPATVKIDGKSVKGFSFDAKTQRLRVTLPNEDVRQVEISPLPAKRREG
jgi:alpha-glucosidase